MNAPSAIINGNELSYYSIFPWTTEAALNVAVAGNREFDVPYSSLAPSGETRPLHITNCFLQVQGPQTKDLGVAAVVVESPAGSGVWKLPLAQSLDDVNGGRDQQAFNPGVILSPGDALCIQVVWNAQTAKASVWTGTSASSSRRISMGIEATFG